MSEQDVTDHMKAQVVKLGRVAAQMAQLIAQRRRQAQMEAARASMAQREALRARIDMERRLAAPIVARAADSRFWAAATVEDAAYVYGVSQRLADIDPVARQAAERCEREARERWGADLTGRDPAGPQEVTTEEVARVVPVLPGEQAQDSGFAQEAISTQAQQQAPTQGTGQEPGPSAEQANRLRSMMALAMAAPAGDSPSPSVDLSQADPTTQADHATSQRPAAPSQEEAGLSAEQREAVAWVDKHGLDLGLERSASDGERRWGAWQLYSAMAAEGVDLEAPPSVDDLRGRVPDDLRWEAGGTWRHWMSQATGVPADQVERHVDMRETDMLAGAAAAQAQGRYPDLGRWYWGAVRKGSDAALSGPGAQVRLDAEPPSPGRFTHLARAAAAPEAAEAGMDEVTYLAYLPAHMRRSLIAAYTAGQAERGYEAHGYYDKGVEALAGMRVRHVQAAAAQWPQLAHADWVTSQRTQDQEQAPAQVAEQAQPTAGEVAEAAAAAEQEEDPDQEREEAAAVVTGQAPVPTASVAQAAWDSEEARAAWAAQKIDEGLDPALVRAALAGDRTMHQPLAQALAKDQAPTSVPAQVPQVPQAAQMATSRL